jgi:antitoxin (DNA-binding transcriptional repressor) of toxin-antitoxin stability system
MDIAPTKVSVREFRAHLAEYMGATTPVMVTRHGETIGYYIPARPAPDKAEIDALKEAASRFDALLAKAGINEEDVLEEFRKLRGNKEK